MKKRAISLGITVALAATAGAADLPANSRPSAVTVYNDRAAVTRTATVKLPAGVSTIRFTGLPGGLLPDSLRITGKGTASVKVLGVDQSVKYNESPLLPELKRLQDELETLQWEMQSNRDRNEPLNLQEKFVRSIEAVSSQEMKKELVCGKPDVLAISGVNTFIGKTLADIKEGKLSLAKTAKTQEAKQHALLSRINEIQVQKQLMERQADVLVDAAAPGDFQGELSYTVMGGGWSPLYTLRAMPETGETELVLSAKVRQTTGEDWTDVTASLSTATPAAGATPGELSPWRIDVAPPVHPVLRGEARTFAKRNVMDAEVMMGSTMSAPTAMPAPAPMLEKSTTISADIQESGVNVVFAIPRTITVQSDGTERKVPLDMRRLKTRYSYQAVPKLREAAYLIGTAKNDLPFPILPGVADLFIGADFVGNASLSFAAVNDEVKLYFGEDRSVAVRREQVKKERGTPGIFGKTAKIRLEYRTTITNHKNEGIEIELFDQIPVSQHDTIVITSVELQPEPKKDDQGKLTYILHLAPGEKKELKVGFTVEYPEGTQLIGL